MLEIAVCDDEVQEGNQFVAMLRIYEKQRKKSFAIDVYTEGESLLASGKNYDIVLLDVEMKQVNGIETGHSIWCKNKQCNIIYVTNLMHCREMAQNKVHAFAYLIKPVTQETLFEQLDDVFSQLDASDKSMPMLNVITVRQEYVEIPIQDIYFFEYRDRKVNIHTRQQIYIIKESIGDMAERMLSYDFVMPHQSFLVNLRYINHIQKYEVTLTSGDIIPLSQKRSASFRKLFHEYIKKLI